MQKTKVLLTGGGTGGHVFPLVAIARDLIKKGADVAFLGPEEFPLDVLTEEGVRVEKIVQAGKIRRYWSLKTFGEIVRIPKAFWQARKFVKSWRPHIVLGKGGYGSLMPVLVARMHHIPIVLHESDAIPGVANKWLSKYADKIVLSFSSSKSYFRSVQTVVLGNPVRKKFSKITKTRAKKVLGLTTRRKIIFVTGGSQGSRSINDMVREVAPALLKKYALVIASGKTGKDLFGKIEDQKTVVIRDFLNEEELSAAYTLADVIVSRSGSGGIFEMSFFGKPAVLIPLSSSAGNHQAINAKIYEQAGAATVLDEKLMESKELLFAIESILGNPEIKERMEVSARKFSKPEASLKVADLLLVMARDRFWAQITKKA